jgi:hypothetical protein
MDELDLMRVVLLGVLLFFGFKLELSRQERQDRFLENCSTRRRRGMK